MTGYDFHPKALGDLDEIWDFIRADNLDAADRDCRNLGSHSCEYLIAYAPDQKPLWVVAIMHGRCSPRVMAAILRTRE